MLKVAPSILSADFSRLGDEIKEIQTAGADYVHFDVMDGVFVPNISIGIPVLESVRKATDMFIDVHLMIERPLRYAESFCRAGADLVNFHVESDSQENILKAISVVKDLGKKVGVTIKPRTGAEAVLPYLSLVDLVLVMTVEPGFGGQSFMMDQLSKISAVRELIEQFKPDCELEVDGGMEPSTAAEAVGAGADVLVAGSAIFKAADRKAVISALRACKNTD